MRSLYGGKQGFRWSVVVEGVFGETEADLGVFWGELSYADRNVSRYGWLENLQGDKNIPR